MTQQLKSFKDLGISTPEQAFEGDKIELMDVINKPITVHKFIIGQSKFTERGNGKLLTLQITINGQKRVIFTGSGVLMDTCQRIPVDGFPFTATIIKDQKRLLFT